jgi:hypothetical protein
MKGINFNLGKRETLGVHATSVKWRKIELGERKLQENVICLQAGW